MNAKKAKQLRRIAEGVTTGMKPVSKILSDRGTSIVNSPKSTRGAYRKLKAIARRLG